ncbi:L,D-transpeptidase family protein [Paenibacillus sp. TRM 82003]|nr:L,D-transpeptidase family protein [Paenibacillus sp. TRM 82003]
MATETAEAKSGAGSAMTPEDSLLIVNKTINELAYFHDGALVKTFPVATGRKASYTPEGTFPIVNKIKNRPYYKEKIPGGDPRNPLGDRWLGLDARGTYGTTYAIHGNNNPNAIGKYVSAGCIRMNNDDIHWLFERIAKKTNVVIVSSELSFEELAAEHGYELQRTFEGGLEIDGVPVVLATPALTFRGTTYLPLRACFELLGGIVDWNAETGLVTSSLGDRTVVHRPGTAEVAVDGLQASLDTPSRHWNDTVMLPLRDIAELAGWTVHWEAEAKRIRVESVRLET